ncbi:MAG: GTP-binding protein [Cloacibacillus porcorum]|uniref:CobW family GTP-binding protein n=1 Tax=Cloacibacillus porcorum TaxID=1197717 RepID=UPI0023F1F9D5|nr:GTP-binding protein [Cloacibacillus porcorum]MCD7875552.1 GTP-binding protein [Cloacibacillus porcorum]
MKESKCKEFLLSGFLGSGKTTLLKHLLETHPEGERIAVLMNEFGKAGVDGDVVRKNGLEIIEISRGSIFCACAKGDFLRGLYTILKDYQPTILLVEASGVADTTDMKKDLSHGMLHDYYQMAGNICVIDAVHFEDWLDLFNAVIRQTEAATDLIINKTDLVSAEEADALEAHLRQLNPAARITRAAFGNVPWEIFRPAAEPEEKIEEIPEMAEWEKFIDDTLSNMTPHMAPPDNLASLSVFWEGDPEKFKEVLDKLPDDIVRSKGYFIDADGRWKVFDIVGSGKPVYSAAAEDFSQPRNLAIFIRRKRARREIPGLFQDAGIKLLELRF